MKINHQNAIVHLAMQDGTVGLYSPNQEKGSLMKILAMREPIQSIAVDSGGRYLATAGVGKTVNIFDIRNVYEPVVTHYLKF